MLETMSSPPLPFSSSIGPVLVNSLAASGLHAIRDVVNPPNPPLWEGTTRSWVVFHGTARLGMGFAAGLLLIICSLLAGLILAVCGLDATLLRLRTVTGTPRERKQAAVVARMKGFSTWMLCSLIIISVACGEAFPFALQTVFDIKQIWIPILVSTLAIAVFAEILPQYIMPKNAIAWGFYCAPLIWFCMWLTALISYPLAWVLDSAWSRKNQGGVFSNEELAALIKYHEKPEKHGGMVSTYTSRTMIGALKLDSRPLSGFLSKSTQNTAKADIEKDVEKADMGVDNDMIVNWSSVRTVNIDEKVDEAFVAKVKGWSYSRIPVIGRPPKSELGAESPGPKPWNGTQIFGFLHVKNLIGLDLSSVSQKEILVKDLPLYPMPIVREDMSVFDLMNIFQLGISRIAIVIPTPPRETSFCTVQFTTNHSLHGFADFKTMLWTATQRTNARILSKLNGETEEEKDDFNQDCLETVSTDSFDGVPHKTSVVGIRSPKPVGIVTFEDIVDALLQKTSRDEKDFYDRGTTPPTKSKKIGDFPNLDASNLLSVPNHDRTPNKLTKKNSRENGSLRQRKVSAKKAPFTLDGVDEHTAEPPTDTHLKPRKSRVQISESMYTSNSRGGFHGPSMINSASSRDAVRYSLDHAEVPALMNASSPFYVNPNTDVQALLNSSSPSHLGNSHGETVTASLPSRKTCGPYGPYGLKHQARHFSAATTLPVMRPLSSFEQPHRESNRWENPSELVMPVPATDAQPEDGNFDGHLSGDEAGLNETIRHALQKGDDTGETQSLDSDMEHWGAQESLADQVEHHQIRSSENNTPYGGFPLSLLENTNKNKRIPDFSSSTMPRMSSSLDYDERDMHEVELRNNDNHLVLSSQRKGGLGESDDGARRSSIWF